MDASDLSNSSNSTDFFRVRIRDLPLEDDSVGNRAIEERGVAEEERIEETPRISVPEEVKKEEAPATKDTRKQPNPRKRVARKEETAKETSIARAKNLGSGEEEEIPSSDEESFVLVPCNEEESTYRAPSVASGGDKKLNGSESCKAKKAVGSRAKAKEKNLEKSEPSIPDAGKCKGKGKSSTSSSKDRVKKSVASAEDEEVRELDRLPRAKRRLVDSYIKREVERLRADVRKDHLELLRKYSFIN